MSKSKILACLFMLILTISSFTNGRKNPPPFTAKFYDETGIFLGTFGETDDNSPIYVASCETLFPNKFRTGDLKMTPKEIILKVGTEIIYDRFQPIVELNTHVGICKLPPKKHRVEIREIIEKVHLDAHNPRKIDGVEYEIGGCGYHNNAGELLHLPAENGKPSGDDRFPSIEVFNAVDYYSKVDSNQQLITDNGSKLISERRVEYTWHTHPPKINPRLFEQSPSYHDYLFGNNYQYIKQHFLVSLKFKLVYYYGYGTESPHRNWGGVDNYKAYNFKMNYETFFALN
jgi:hypothetical protein